MMVLPKLSMITYLSYSEMVYNMHLFHVRSKALIVRIVTANALHHEYSLMDLATIIHSTTRQAIPLCQAMVLT